MPAKRSSGVLPGRRDVRALDSGYLPDRGVKALGHQGQVFVVLSDRERFTRGTNLKVLFSPLDVLLGASVVAPYLLVAPASAFAERDLPTPPLLVVEVRSRSTAWLDQGRKRTLFEEHGIAHYWLADPHVPSVTVLDLIDGHYVQTAHVTGDDVIRLRAPFSVTLKPSDLVT